MRKEGKGSGRVSVFIETVNKDFIKSEEQTADFGPFTLSTKGLTLRLLEVE
jgi:hypothetical protein